MAEPPAPADHGGIGRKVGIASLYAVLQRFVLRGLGFFSTLILVRLLSPEDFGIATMASAVLATLDVLTLTGFGLAIVRMPQPTRAHYDTSFTLTVARGVLLALLLVLLAPWQAELMKEPRLEPVIWVIALSALLDGFVSARMIDLYRDLRFDVLLKWSLVGKLLAMAISIPLAPWLQNYWALVLGVPLSRLFTVPYSYWLCPYRPRLSLAAWRDLLNFSKWMLASNVCLMLDQQLMNFVVGRIRGMAAVGLYQVGGQIALLPVTELAAPLQAPFYSGFSKIYHDLAELRRQFSLGFELQWLVLLPMTAGIALTAREVTLIFLGERWTEAIVLMPLIAFFGLFDQFGTNTFNIFRVLNRQGRMVTSYVALILVRVLAVIWATLHYGILGAAWAMLLTALLNVVIWQLQANALLAMPLPAFLRLLWRGSLAALLMAAAVQLVPDDLGLGPWPVVLALLAKSMLGALVYAGAVFGLWWLAGRPAGSAEATLLKWGIDVLAKLGLAGWRDRAAAAGLI